MSYEKQMHAHHQWRRVLRHGSRKTKVLARRARALSPIEAIAAIRIALKG